MQLHPTAVDLREGEETVERIKVQAGNYVENRQLLQANLRLPRSNQEAGHSASWSLFCSGFSHRTDGQRWCP